MTYREQREARAERLRGWAEKREVRGTAELEQAHQMAQAIPFGQPILVGHHSEGRDRRYRDRIHNTMGRGVENTRKAEEMRSRADNIEAAAAGAIYSDDPDAIERLEEKLAGLEAKREAIKAHNKAMRKPTACDHPADCDCRTRYPRNCGCKNHPLPSYALSNLGGVITTTRQRLEGLKRQAAAREAVVETEVEVGDIVVRTTAARVEVEFPGKPSAEIRTALKGRGFRWDPVKVCWYGRDEAFAIEVAKGA
jgi:hypothetical protein